MMRKSVGGVAERVKAPFLRRPCNNDRMFYQWHSKEGQVGARALGHRPWGRTSTLFAVI